MAARWLLVLPLCALVAGCGDDSDEPARFTISCAASLRHVMPDLLEAYAKTGAEDRFRLTLAGSGTLRRQVEAGAPVCGVILADAENVDRLIAGGYVAASTRSVIARNVLVLIGSAESPDAKFRTLTALPDGTRIAIGDPRFVPAGRYARLAFEQLGTWAALRERMLPAADVAAVTAYVRRGEVALGIAYATEVRGVPAVRILDRAEGDWAPRAVIVAGACEGAEGAGAFRGFLRFQSSASARAVWKRHGFLSP